MLELAVTRARPPLRHLMAISRRAVQELQTQAQREPLALINGLRLLIVVGCLATRAPLKASLPLILMSDALCTAWARQRVSPRTFTEDRRVRVAQPERPM
jgi:hypothetical protein